MTVPALRIAVDIGGTFTDGVAEEHPGGRIWVGKCLTTPSDPGEGVSTVVAQLLAKIGGDGSAANVAEFVHGTTLVTNTLIERKGAETALVTTKGCGDVLDIRRELRYDLYDLALELPEAIVPADRRVELAERLDWQGQVLAPVDEDDLKGVVDRLRSMDVDAIAICLLHGYVNDVHERHVAAALARALPGKSISISSRVAREIREYERMSTVVANAYVQPIVARYLSLLETRIREIGVPGPLRIMLSSGGFTSPAAAAETPIQLLESGPAAGVLSAVNAGMQAGIDHILAFDMGGTTAKACVSMNGVPDIDHAFEAARVKRFKRGSGLPILIPSIDLIEIGAGGGSIASVDALGLLKVGPQSAGSVPGPACYGLGGTDATVTDADLVLGYIDADSFLGGEMTLRKDLAEEAIGRLGERIGLGMVETAWGIVNIVNENMAAAARAHIAEKGLDPRAFTMIATGGAGPVHVAEVGRKLGVKRILCAIAAGAGSCLGLLAAPARVDRSWSKPQLLDELDWHSTGKIIAELHAEASEELKSSDVDLADVDWSLLLEMRYAGQGSTVGVTVPYREVYPELGTEFRGLFEAAYAKLYGSTVPDGRIQAVTWRLTGKAKTTTRKFSWAEMRSKQGSATPRRRKIFLPIEQAYGEVDVYDRYALPPGSVLKGPLILEERESTFAIPFPTTVSILEDLTVSVEIGE